MLILKQNAANTVPTPPAGKGTIFLDDSDTLSVKTSDGNVETFPTVAASNSQVVFMNGTALSGEAALTYDFNNNVLNISGNVAAGNVKTDNLLYANGVPWDLSDPGGSNTQIQFNDDESFGGSSAFTFNKSSNLVSMGGALSVTGNANVGNIGAASGIFTTVTGTLTTDAQPNITSVGTLSSLAVTANITAGNVYANSGVIGASVLTGTLSTAAQPNITSVGSLTSLTVTGNANVSNIGGNNGVFTTVSGTLSTASQPNITSVGTLSALGVNGNLTASNINANTGAFYGNGAGLTNIPGGNIVGNISGNISNANFAAFAAEVTDASQPNITSVGTLVDLTVTGNASAGNVNTAGKVVASSLESNVTTGTAPFVVASTTKVTNLNADLLDGYSTATAATGNTVVIRDTDGSFSANIITATLSGAATTAGTVTTAAQPNITSVGTLSSLAVTGNATAGNVYANSGTIGASLLTGTLTTDAQPNITSVGTLSALTVTGNASAGNISTGGALSVTGNANVGNIGATNGVFTNVSGNGSSLSAITGANVTGTVPSATTAGTVTTAAQPNITSVGTLTSLAVTGNATAGNVYANSGTIGASLLTGTLTTAAQPNITSTGTLTSLTVTGTATAGNLSTGGTLSVTGNANVGNLGTGGLITATGNVSGGNLTTAGALSVTGNANVGNIGAAAGVFTTVTGSLTTAAQPNVTSLGTLTSLAITGNATAGNVYANSGTVGASLLTGTLTTAAQPNITSVGTLSSLSVTGNVAAGNLTTTGVLSVTGTGVSSIAGNLDMTSNNIINLATPVAGTDAATKQYVDDLASTALVYHEGVIAATTGTLASATGGTITYNNGTAGVGATLTTTGTFNLIDTANVQTVGARILVKNEANAAHNGVYTYTSTTVITRATDADSYGPGADELSLNNYFFVSGGDVNKGSAYVLDAPTGTITFGTSNIEFAQFSSSQVYLAGTGLTLANLTFSVNASQSQITSVGTLTSLGVSGTITAANITANTGVFTGNGSALTALNASNISTGTLAQARLANASVTLGSTALTLGSTVTTVAGLSSVTSTTFVGALTGAATTAGTVTTAAQPNITSVGTLSSLSVTGTATAGNLSTGGTLSVTGNANVGNIGAAAGVFTSVSGNGSALTALNASNISTGTLAQARLANASVTLGSTALTLGSTVTTVAGLSSVTSTTFVGALTGAATTAGTVTTAAQPNITSVGTLTGLTLSGTLTGAVQIGTGTATHFGTTLTTGANSTAGTITGNWSLSAGSRLNATYADLAEKYVADADYEAGTVLIFGGAHEVTLSTDYDSHRVAGVVSTNPAYTMNNDCAGAHIATIALQGRVPVKVHGPITKGDLMVSGADGRAVANNMARAGTILGKALENFEGGSGVIEVAVGRF
jgi:hypothetical protein